ncbi:MAG TPA: hypothetical protein VFS19_04310 [Planctomycetota bacterium]|nr:hypothetical protein [Planctomycetota bacterium]
MLTKLRDRAAKVALILGVAGLVLTPAAVLILPAAFGRTVQLVTTPNAPDIVALNRTMWSKGEPVAPIYGTPVGEPMTILFADKSRIIVPAEDPSLTLYTVDKSKGENPLQAQTIRFGAKFGLIGSAILMGAGALHFVWKRWRKPGSLES